MELEAEEVPTTVGLGGPSWLLLQRGPSVGKPQPEPGFPVTSMAAPTPHFTEAWDVEMGDIPAP